MAEISPRGVASIEFLLDGTAEGRERVARQNFRQDIVSGLLAWAGELNTTYLGETALRQSEEQNSAPDFRTDSRASGRFASAGHEHWP